MSILNYKEDGSVSINKAAAFCELNNNSLPSRNKSIKVLLDEMDSAIRSVESSIKSGALANSHGDWYEWILAFTALNIHLSGETNYIAVLLPNVARFTVSDLYEVSIQNIVEDLKHKVQSSAGVEFVTSNPDLVIIDISSMDIDLGFTSPVSSFNTNTIHQLECLYEKFIGLCSFENIIGYLSVKTSFRPDRRLQIPHEGSLMKAVYAHLQTRQWILNPKGLSYYAVSTKVGPKDTLALRTVATHSIITVNTTPQAAVDQVFEVDSIESAEQMFNVILNG
jgi:hypothetical protein